jgi:DNA repair protein RecO
VLRVEVSLGTGELGTLAAAELSRPFLGILADLDKLAIAGAACELVREALPMRQPEPAVFTTTVALLGAIDVAADELHPLLLGFSWRVMTLVGFAPGLDACGTCGKQPRPTQAGVFDPVLGALSCRACGGAGMGRSVKLAGTTLASMRRALGPDWFNAFDATAPSELRRVRGVTSEFIEQRLERRLHGVSVLLQVDSDREN